MDTSSMTFSELLFHGRYHIIGGLIFLVFAAAFVREVVRELIAQRAARETPARTVAFGPLVHDSLLGATMTDGGEPVEDGQNEERNEEQKNDD